MNKETLRELALRGARVRLEELAAEWDVIVRTFPELRKEARKGRSAKAHEAAARAAWEDRQNGKASAEEPPAKPKRPMSTAQRKALAKALKARWAKAKESGRHLVSGKPLKGRPVKTARVGSARDKQRKYKIGPEARANMARAAKARGQRQRAEHAAKRAQAESRVPS